MIHSVRIKGGKASYCNSFVDTAKLRIETAANRSIIGKIGDKRGLSGLAHILLDAIKKLLGVVDASNGLGTANTALAYHAGRMLALHEGDAPYWIRIACEGLVETIGRVSYGGKLQHAFTAHPKIDPVTKELFAFGYSVEKAPHCWALRCDAKGELVTDFPVPLERPVMMHDCALTENYFIIVDAPLLFTPDAIVKGHLPFTFDNTLPLKFGVVDRYAQDSSEIKWFSVEPCMSFHVANAWETSSTAIELYLCTFKEFSLDDFTAAGPEAEPHLTRVTLDLATGEATSQLLCPLTGDFPTVPASLVARKTKWCYVAAFETSPFGAPLFYGITKVDLEAQGPETAVVGTIHHGDGRLGGEAYFVSREGLTANGEDNGYLITYVWDEQTQTSELVIYDAATMSSTPVARVGMPQRVPFGFHCTWMTEEQMQEQRAG
jgi:carotenoid 9,10(9',10')-cleavage dioxygenase 1